MSTSKTRQLRELIGRSKGLVICGVHDGLSARLAERSGFEGLWAGGFGITACKAIPDVGMISMSEHLAVCIEINRATRLPVVADVDDGFGDVINVIRVVREYEAAGIAAICLEDNEHPKRNSLYQVLDRQLVSRDVFAAKIRAAKDHQRTEDFVVIARTEALVADLGLAEAVDRAYAYADAGADLVLVHCKDPDPDLVYAFAKQWDRDVPLAAVPTTYPDATAEDLVQHGYRLIVFANHPMRAAVKQMDHVMRKMVTTGSLRAVDDEICTLGEVFSLVDFEEVNRLTERYIQHVGEPRDILSERIISAHMPDRADAPALEFRDRTLSYGELQRLVSHAMKIMQRCGVGDGDRVMLVLQNSPEFLVAFLAITSLGAIAAPVDPQAGAERFRFIALDTAPLFIVADHPDQLPANTGVAVCTAKLGLEEFTFSLSPEPPSLQRPATRANVGAHTAAAIFFTGGATGRPKGVVLKHGHFLAIARTLSSRVGMDQQHRELVISPMTHSGGWQRVTSTLLAGGCVVISEGFLSPSVLFDDIRQHRIKGFFTTPPFLRTILKLPAQQHESRPESLRSIEIASAPVTAEELRKLMELLPDIDVWLQYGLTECSRAIMLDARRYPNKLHTIGQPTAGIEVAVFSQEGKQLDPGQDGEIALRGPQRTDHYWNLPDLNLSRFRDDWLLTGDYGLVDEDGFIVLQGRRDDMINCGGFSYFPTEVEVALGPLDGVRAYLVAGVPDPQGVLSEVPWLFAEPYSPETWTPEQATKYARKRLPAHMVPRKFVIVPELPISPSGKVNRRLAVLRYGPQELQ